MGEVKERQSSNEARRSHDTDIEGIALWRWVRRDEGSNVIVPEGCTAHVVD